MSEFWSDVLTLIGLIFTCGGASIAASAVLLRPEDAVDIGISRLAAGSYEQDLELPMVQNLLKASRNAKCGLIAVAFGTVLQGVPVVCRLLGVS